jgi:hypothetical protein
MSHLKLDWAAIKRGSKKAGIACRNLPLTLTAMAILTCVELFTAGGIAQTTTETVSIFGYALSLAALEIGISYGSGILAIIGFGVAAELKSDPRPEQRDREANTFKAAIAALVIPIFFFTNALAVQVQRAQRLEYIGSERYEMHRAAALGQCLELALGEECYVSTEEQTKAQAELRTADEVKTARLDFAWACALLAAIFVYGVLGWAKMAFHKPRPETPWEAKERVAAQRRADARRRARDKQMAEIQKLEIEAATARVANRPGFIRGLFLGFKKAA